MPYRATALGELDLWSCNGFSQAGSRDRPLLAGRRRPAAGFDGQVSAVQQTSAGGMTAVSDEADRRSWRPSGRGRP